MPENSIEHNPNVYLLHPFPFFFLNLSNVS